MMKSMSQTTTTKQPMAIRSVIWATALISALIFVATSALVWMVTGELINGVGAGVFSAVWGGPGFGVTVGGAAHAVAIERRQDPIRHKRPAVRPRVAPSSDRAGGLAVSHLHRMRWESCLTDGLQ